jgi:thymidylate kinase
MFPLNATVQTTIVPSDGSELLGSLLTLLDNRHVRYCLLHFSAPSSTKVLEQMDFAIHPSDLAELSLVSDLLRSKGWLVIRSQFVDGTCYSIELASRGNQLLRLTRINFVFDLSQMGLGSGEAVVKLRRREEEVWRANQPDELLYLLTTYGGAGLTPHQQSRLQTLVTEIGGEAQSIARKFAPEWTRNEFGRLLERCGKEPLVKVHPTRHFAGQLRLGIVAAIGHVLRGIVTSAGNLFRPPGLFLVVLGPDGVGKSTAVQQIQDKLSPLFKGYRTFHCRPFVLKRSRGVPQPVARPHEQPVRGPWLSALFLLGFLVDCWLGYLLNSQPFLMRSGLVIFDRYLQDMLIDPKRYRYGGPRWLIQLVCRFMPPNDPLFLVLDAKEEEILRRKQELPLVELRRQRNEYRHFVQTCPKAVSVDCNDIEQASLNVLWAILEHLSRRSHCCH